VCVLDWIVLTDVERQGVAMSVAVIDRGVTEREPELRAAHLCPGKYSVKECLETIATTTISMRLKIVIKESTYNRPKMGLF